MTGVRAELLALAVGTQRRLRHDEGATAVEHGLMVGPHAVAITGPVILPG